MGSGYTHTKGAIERFKPQKLMDELKNSGVKYNEKDVILVAKNYEGKLLWLEKGNGGAGLRHIIERHKKDFDPQINILDLLMKILPTKPIKHFSRARDNRLELADVFYIKQIQKYIWLLTGITVILLVFIHMGKDDICV